MSRKSVIIIIVIVLLIGAFLAWLFIASNQPQPGEIIPQQGRTHIEEGSKTNYKSNPPTSGDHYPSWITKGFYDTPRADGNLVHSEEHGYIIFWYNCDKKLQSSKLIPTVFAADENEGIKMTTGGEGSASAQLSDLPKTFSDGSCDSLKNQIKDVMKKNGDTKLIAVPRVSIDYPLILTAWGRMEKLNSIDQNKIKAFVDAYRDQGPEEPSP